MSGPDKIDRDILTRLQDNLPLETRPYAALAAEIGTTEDKLLRRINALMKNGLIRRIGPVVDQARLGRATTLAAVAAPEKLVDEIAAAICALPGVSHCYLRGAEDGGERYNVWFTLAAATREELEATLRDLGERIGLPVASFPAKKFFKLRVRLDMTGECGDV